MVAYRKSNGDWIPIPTWVWTSVGVLALTAATSIGAAANAEYSKRIEQIESLSNQKTNHEVRITHLEDTLADFAARTDGKLDRLLEQTRK